MTLCQDDLAEWTSRYQTGITMKASSQQLYEQAVALNGFQGSTLTTALMHELTHAPAIVGENYLRTSPFCGLLKAHYWNVLDADC